MDFFEVQIMTGIAEDLSPGTVLWTLESYLSVCLVLHYPLTIPITPKLYLYLRRLLSQILKRFSGRNSFDVMGHLPKPVLY
ncbi:MAG: hypothetical protein KVP17_004985 [Porospora cf. gigantea B]|nr:MAG: hypothetical protein KVP17_004985 [Porospora cf. gigantea B]